MSVPTYAERLAATAKPREAMLVLAEGIDAILASLAAATAPPADDGWGDWTRSDPNGVIGENPGVVLTTNERDEAAIDEVTNKLAEATDPDDIRALEARLWLLKDEGQAIEQGPADGARAVVQDDTVTIPPASPERRAARYTWAMERNLWEFMENLTEGEAAEAYAAGGPVWLYANRDAVMQMPIDWRRDLIADLELDSPAAAQEMARDILKTDTDPDHGRP